MKQQLLLLLIYLVCPAESKLYQNAITKNTKVIDRQWVGFRFSEETNWGGWLVRVRSGGANTFSCCGAYYSPLLVISSANCISPFRYQLDDASVVSTANADDEDFSFSPVYSVYTPHDFVPQKTNLDIAIVRLSMPLKGKMTEFIKLASMQPAAGTSFSTFGWGYDSLEVQPPSDEPRKTIVQQFDIDRCKKLFPKGFVSNTVLCAKFPQDSFECIYDGGSPIVWNNELVGIASVGATCKNTTNPGIYTSIIKMKPYIFEIHKGVRSGQLSRNKRQIRAQWQSQISL
ncbi:seminase-like [Drosophila montana]|uniref:seminase-like n=1 Tax=Drosophila montana TaxID=40370 RepID=UPI00313C6090